MQVINRFLPFLNAIILFALFTSGWNKANLVSDFRDYYRASNLLTEKQDIYQYEEIKELQTQYSLEDLFKPEVREKLESLKGNIASYIYPPSFAVFLYPITFTKYETASKIFFLINFLCLLGCIYLLSQMSFPGNFALTLFLTLIFSYRFLENHAVNNQVGFILTYLGLLAVHSKNDKWSGALLSLAVIIKLTPAIFLLYFFTSRRWKFFIYFGIFLLFWSLFPVIFGWEYGLRQWQNWFEMVLFNAMKSPLFRAWKNNQSLIATLAKYFLIGADPLHQQIFKMPFFVLSPEFVKNIFSLLSFGLLGFLGWRFKKGLGEQSYIAALFILSVVLSGVSWVHSFVVLLVPIFFLSHNFLTYKNTNGKIFLTIGTLSVLTHKTFIGPMESLFLMYSILLYISLGYFFLLLYSETKD
jgi:hypothetical protein